MYNKQKHLNFKNMKVSQLRQLIHEEVSSMLNEVPKKPNEVPNLFLTQTGTDSKKLKEIKQNIYDYIKGLNNLDELDDLILDLCQQYKRETR